jgi:hypothetical protein
MLAELILAIALSGGTLQVIYVTTGPCTDEFTLFQLALEDELTKSNIQPKENFTLSASTGWNADGKACYLVSLSRDGDDPKKAATWIMLVRNFTPAQAAKVIVANIRLTLSGRFGGGRG